MIEQRINKMTNEKKPVMNSRTTNKENDPLKLIASLDISCPHFDECSGCELAKSVNHPPILEEVNHYFKKRGFTDFHLRVGDVTHWRYRAKLVVRGTSKNPEIGLFKKGTHQVFDIPFCKVHQESINKAVELVKKFIQKENIEPYNEQTGKGLLRYIQFVVERSTGKVQITFVLNSNEETDLKKWVISDDEIWHSVWLNFNLARTNNIFGSDWTHIKGPPLIFEGFGLLDVCFHPASFAQSNLQLFEEMLESIHTIIPENSKVVEYYAGVGVIGLKIATKCQSVVCCEITPQAEECFNVAKSKLDMETAKKITFETGLSERRLDLIKEKDVCIVDPPRKGVDINLLDEIVYDSNLKKIIYVSCGFKAFQRDCDFILKSNLWKIERVEPYLFFPGSNHIEILAVFKKI